MEGIQQSGEPQGSLIADDPEARAAQYLARLNDTNARRAAGTLTPVQAHRAREALIKGMEQFGFVDMASHVESFLRESGQTVKGQNERQSTRMWKLLEIKTRELEQSYWAEDGEATLNAGLDLIWATLSLLMSEGHDVRGAFKEVARANDDKVRLAKHIAFDRFGRMNKPEGWKAPQLAEYVGF